MRKNLAEDIRRTGRAETDVLKYMGGLALELIAQGGFGHRVGVLDNPGQSVTLDSILKRVSYVFSSLTFPESSLKPMSEQANYCQALQVPTFTSCPDT